MLEHLTVAEPWFSHIQSSKKKIEGRLYRGRYKKLSLGNIVVGNSDGSIVITRKIISLKRYHSFKELLENEGLENTLPGINTIKDGVKVYRHFYSADDELEHGVLAIELE